MTRSTRCPCGLSLVDGRCPPCDAIDALMKGAGRGGGRRKIAPTPTPEQSA